MEILAVENLTVSLKERTREIPLLHDLSFSLQSGEVLGLTGPSGAGKSLTAQALCGLVDPPLAWTGGRIVLDGREILPSTPRRWDGRRGNGIFLIFQSPASALNPNLRISVQIGEALTEVCGYSAARAAASVRQLLEKVDLPADTGDRYPFELSGGMRQRVLIAIALGLRPKVVVADEPTSGLDPLCQGEVMTALGRMPSELGTALVILSHDLRLFRRLANRIGVLYQGRLVELTDPATLFQRPAHGWSRKLIQSLMELNIEDEAPFSY